MNNKISAVQAIIPFFLPYAFCLFPYALCLVPYAFSLMPYALYLLSSLFKQPHRDFPGLEVFAPGNMTVRAQEPLDQCVGIENIVTPGDVPYARI